MFRCFTGSLKDERNAAGCRMPEQFGKRLDADAPFTDADKPLMVAHDKTFPWGQVGIGTFDDTADFDEVKLWGKRAEPPISSADKETVQPKTSPTP